MAIPTERRKYFKSDRIKVGDKKKFGLKPEDMYKTKDKEETGSTSAAQSMADWSSMNDAYKKKAKTGTDSDRVMTSHGFSIPKSAVSKSSGGGYDSSFGAKRYTGGGTKSFGASGDTSSRSKSFGSPRDTGGGKKAFG